MTNKTRRLTESAMLLAAAVALEFLSKLFIPEMPFGGQITLASMLPVILISYRYGVQWGLLSGFTYALLEMALGAKTMAAAFQPGYFGDTAMIGNAILMIFLDYILAFTLLGLGGMFRNKGKRPGLSLALGSVTAIFLRYCVHVLSGYILFGAWGEWFFTQEGFPAWGAKLVAALSPKLLALVYSLVYNAMYILPEMVITAIAALIIGRASRIVRKAA